MTPRVLILTGYGINCDEETRHSFEHVGSIAKTVHLQELIDNPNIIDNCNIFVIPGGFSFGDYTGSGNVFALKLLNKLSNKIENFIQKDKLVLGICNGCQILLRTGLLEHDKFSFDNAVSITKNHNIKNYHCSWFNFNLIHKNSSPWLNNIKKTMYMPIAHAEGCFRFKNNSTSCRIALTYKEQSPSGSERNTAGVLSKNGKILAMMPHPERAFYNYQCYNHDSLDSDSNQYGDGYWLFKNAVDYFL